MASIMAYGNYPGMAKLARATAVAEWAGLSSVAVGAVRDTIVALVRLDPFTLWKLFRLPKWQRDLKVCWTELERGGYDWAHLAFSLWPKRVKEACKTDRSIAIAHGLEALCEVKAPEKQAKRRKKKTDAELELEGGAE